VGIPEEGEEGEEEEGGERVISEVVKARGRAVFERAYKRMKDRELKEEVCSSAHPTYFCIRS
jgi:hypothetical protein